MGAVRWGSAAAQSGQDSGCGRPAVMLDLNRRTIGSTDSSANSRAAGVEVGCVVMHALRLVPKGGGGNVEHCWSWTWLGRSST